uniref:Glycosyltransferase n=1 Tax=Dianthus caryophyllus TaxID=3570 RepID=A0A5S9MMA2_DIACA|nr:chalcononaringenin 2'-O-glucosyltransferase [Dianthus caryophyllus]
MVAEPHRLHIVMFPFLAHGHMIPTLDIARLFAARNVEVSIITTPVNAPIFTKAIETGNPLINVELFKFPAKEAGLPEGCENAEIVIRQPELIPQFFKATHLFQQQLEEYLDRVRPDCLVADMFYPWATDSAAKFNLPRLVFHGISCFALCAQESVSRYEPYRNVSSDDEPFALPGLPHEIKLIRSQISPDSRGDKENSSKTITELINDSEVESFGVIMNTFYELEPEYTEFYAKDMGRKAWHIGPVSLCNRSIDQKAQRGKQASIDDHECLAWLDSKEPNSVVYVCFGSTSVSIAPQLREIARALERSGKNFIWAVRDGGNGTNEEWLPVGFEERTTGKGLIIRGWAPQVLILDHKAVGAFVTHCGWNSTLEGISAGVPMVTWPLFAEQFFNEKLVTNVLRTGVSVGVKKWNRTPSVEDLITREAIEAAIREIMEGEKAEEMRLRAKKFKEAARNAVEEGGSSYNHLSTLIDELRKYQTQKRN